MRSPFTKQTIAQHVDPVEKKPLLHFYPGSRAYPVATPGCNFRCKWCQNADISQMPRERHVMIGTETPWHISRFRPAYKMRDRSMTPLSTLQEAQSIGEQEGLRYIYVGNVPGESNTVCHECGQTLIRRSGYRIVDNLIGEGPSARTAVPGWRASAWREADALDRSTPAALPRTAGELGASTEC